jgi:hypothetical protein
MLISVSMDPLQGPFTPVHDHIKYCEEMPEGGIEESIPK